MYRVPLLRLEATPLPAEGTTTTTLRRSFNHRPAAGDQVCELRTSVRPRKCRLQQSRVSEAPFGIRCGVAWHNYQMTRGPSSQEVTGVGNIQNFLQPQHQPALPTLAGILRALRSIALACATERARCRVWKLAEQITAGALGTPEKRGPMKRKPHHAPIYGCPRGFNQLKLGRLIRPLASDAVLNFGPCSEEPFIRLATGDWRLATGDRGGGRGAGSKTTPPPTTITITYGFPNLTAAHKHQNWNNEKQTHVSQRCWLSRLQSSLPHV